MEKEWLLMVKVVDIGPLDKMGNTVIKVVGSDCNERGWVNSSRLVDKDDLVYDEPETGDIFFDTIEGKWQKALTGNPHRFLIHRQPKPDKHKTWQDRCPLQNFPEFAFDLTTAEVEALTKWLLDKPEE